MPCSDSWLASKTKRHGYEDRSKLLHSWFWIERKGVDQESFAVIHYSLFPEIQLMTWSRVRIPEVQLKGPAQCCPNLWNRLVSNP